MDDEDIIASVERREWIPIDRDSDSELFSSIEEATRTTRAKEDNRLSRL